MKKTKFLSAFIAFLMAVSCFAFVNAEYIPELGDGYIRFDYSQISGGTCDGGKSCTVETNVPFDGKNTVKVTPTPEINDSGSLNLDAWSIADFSEKVELPKYKYVVVEYYYDTEDPLYTDKMQLSLLPGGTGVLSSTVSVKSESNVEAGKWAQAVFNFSGKYILNPACTEPWLTQCHFFPFGGTNPSNLTAKDVLYISSFTFYEKNPDPNAQSIVEFERGNPDALGDAPAKIALKEGEQFTLPENTFDLSYGEFKGWKYSEDGTIYQPGETFTMIDHNVTFDAAWLETREHAEYIALNFPDYADGLVDNGDSTLVYEEATMDGKTCMKIIPNREGSSQHIWLDGWSYAGAGVDFDAYKWVVITYKYVSEKPVADARFRCNIMKNGDIITTWYGKDSLETLEANRWTFATFDMTDIDAVLDPNNPHILRQMHIIPFGETANADLAEGDEMYINQIMFFKEKPALEIHEAYMTGYEDGNFKPNKTMSRAEACTVVARILAPEAEIAGTSTFADVTPDKWFAKYVGFCEAKGLLTSYSGNFEPNKAITRAEFAELVYNTGLAKDTGKAVSFTDVTEAHPKYAAIKAAASAELIKGYEDGTFLPDRTITRAQVVTVINRARGRDMTKKDITNDFSFVFLDVREDNWAFVAIAEAAIPHVAMDGRWIYIMINPADMLAGNFEPDYTDGNAMVAEVDRLAEERKNAILNSESDYSTITGTKYYVSNKGNDENDGLTPETAWQTLKKVNITPIKAGDGVLLERGGIWRETVAAKPGVTYSAYGTGNKPRIYGSEQGANAAKWTLFHEDAATGAKIWKYANEGLVDIGAITFNDGEAYAYREIPNFKDGKFVVRGKTDVDFDVKVELDRNLEYFHDAKNVLSGKVPNTNASTGPLYLRCDKGNPGEVFKSIEICLKPNLIVIGGADVTIDNICLMYGGGHGVSSGTVEGLTVKNCEIGWIGGAIQTYSFRGNTEGLVTRFGNGVEIYGGCDRYTVNNNYIYQNYDAGVTHQYGGGTEDLVMDNVTYKGNLIEDCVYSIEYFFGGGEVETAKRSGENILIEDNICRRSGFGFGSTRPDPNEQAHIKSWNSQNPFENYVVRNNIFDRGVRNLLQLCAEYESWLPKMEGNTYIQGYKNEFVIYGKADGIQYENNLSAPIIMENVLKDKTGKHYFVAPIPYYEFPFAE